MRWITNLPESEAPAFIAKCGHGRRLAIGDPMATNNLTVDELKKKPYPFVGIYEITE